MSTKCLVCGAATDAWLCRDDSEKLANALGDLPALMAELTVTLTRQDRGTAAPLYAMRRQRLQLPGRDYAEGTTTLPATPWPLSWDAAALHWAIRNTLATWARHISETRGARGPVGSDVTTVTRWLLSNLEAIRLDEAAGQLWDEITSCVGAIERAIDRQEPDLFAGRCTSPDVSVDLVGEKLLTTVGTCGADLYADLEDTEVRCSRPGCGAVYDLRLLRRRMAEGVDDEWARPGLIADALTTLAEKLPASTLRTWIERDKALAEHVRLHGGDIGRPLVLQVGIDDQGHALYRVGDVRARIAAARSAKASA